MDDKPEVLDLMDALKASVEAERAKAFTRGCMCCGSTGCALHRKLCQACLDANCMPATGCSRPLDSWGSQPGDNTDRTGKGL